MTDVQDSEIVVAEIPKNSREVVRVTLGQYRGGRNINLWPFYRDGAGNLRPGKRGLIIGIRHLPALAAALAQALDAARENGRLPPE